jgi:YqaJ-like viral recombinase domain
MSYEIFEDVEQGSPEWRQLRMGIPTASMFKVLMAKGDEKKGRTTYLYKLAGEIITGEPMENYTNDAMEDGKAREPQLRKDYAFMRDCVPRQVGFIRNGKCGASPDALIGEEKVLEIKRAAPHVLIPMRLRALEDPMYFPMEHYAQCQGALMVSERVACDLLVGYPKMKPLIRTTIRDEQYIDRLRDAVDLFELELRRLIAKLRAS